MKTDDPARVRAALETDRGWSAYALADLEPPYSRHAEWHAAEGVPALALVYRGFDPPLLFAVGPAAGAEILLRDALGEPAYYASLRPEVFDLLRAFGYRVREAKRMHRMLLDPSRFQHPGSPRAERLGAADWQELRHLYRDGEERGEAPPLFAESMLGHGVYFGIREAGALIAAAGTHVFAPGEGVAGVGNIYTRSDRRGRGFGRLATAAVSAELLALGIRTIALNVADGNRAAIHVYESLGFSGYCEYREAVAVRES